jgi:hypothetical protein
MRVGRRTEMTPAARTQNAGRGLREQPDDSAALRARRGEADKMYAASVVKRTASPDGQTESVELQSPLSLVRIHEDRADKRRLALFDMERELSATADPAQSQRLLWEIQETLQQISLEESRAAYLSNYLDLMDMYQRLKSARVKLPADYAGVEADMVQHFSLFKHYTEGRTATAIEMSQLYVRKDDLEARRRRPELLAADRTVIERELGQVNRRLEETEKRAFEYSRAIMSLLQCRNAGVPGSNPEGVMPVEKLLKAMLKADTDDVIEGYRAVSAAATGANLPAGQAPAAAVRDNGTRKIKLDALHQRSQTNAQWVADYSMTMGRLQLHLNRVAAFEYRFTAVPNARGVDRGAATPTATEQGNVLEAVSRLSIRRMQGQVTAIENSVLPVNTFNAGDEKGFIDDMSYRLSLLHESFSPSGGAAAAAGDRLAGKYNPWGTARRQYEAESLFDAVGWPRDPLTTRPKEWAQLTKAEQDAITEKQKTLKDVVNAFVAPPPVLPPYKESLTLVNDMLTDEFWRVPNFRPEELEDKELPPEGTRVTPANAKELAKTYDKRILRLMAARQLEDDFDAFGTRYCKLIHDMHGVVGVNFDVEVAEADNRARKMETGDLVLLLGSGALVAGLLLARLKYKGYKPLAGGVRLVRAGINLMRPPPASTLAVNHVVSPTANIVREYNVASSQFRNLQAAEEALAKAQLATSTARPGDMAKAVKAFEEARAFRNLKAAEYVQDLILHGTGRVRLLVVDGKLTAQGERFAELLTRSSTLSSRELIVALRGLGLEQKELTLVLRSGAMGDLLAKSAQLTSELAEVARPVLLGAMRGGQMTRGEVAIVLRLLRSGKLGAPELKALQAAAAESRLSTEGAHALSTAARTSSYARLLNIGGATVGIAAAAIDAYLLYEGIVKYNEWNEQHGKAKTDMEKQLKDMGFEEDGPDYWKHKETGVRVHMKAMVDMMDRQSAAALMDVGASGLGMAGGLLALYGTFFAMGPVGWAIAIGTIVVSVTVGLVATGRDEKAKIRFLHACPPWLLAAVGTYSTIHKSAADELDYLSSWHTGEFLHGMALFYSPFHEDDTPEIMAMKSNARDKLLYSIFVQEMQAALPELYAELFVNRGNVLQEMQGFFDGEFKSVVQPLFFMRVRQLLRTEKNKDDNQMSGEDIAKLEDYELFKYTSPMQIRKAIRFSSGLHLCHVRETRYLEMVDQLEEDPVRTAEFGGRIVPLADVVESMGEMVVFGRKLKELRARDPKLQDLRLFLRSKGVTSRAQFVMQSRPGNKDGEVHAARIDMPGYAGDFSFGTDMILSFDPVTQWRLRTVLPEVKEDKNGFAEAGRGRNYAVNSLFYAANGTTYGEPVNHERALGQTLNPTDSAQTAQLRQTRNTAQYFAINNKSVGYNHDWTERMFGKAEGRDADRRGKPVVLTSSLQAVWPKDDKPEGPKQERERENIYIWCDAMRNQVQAAFPGMELQVASFQQDVLQQRKYRIPENASRYGIGRYFTQYDYVMQGNFLLRDPKTGNSFCARHSMYAYWNMDTVDERPRLTEPSDSMSTAWHLQTGAVEPLHLSEFLADPSQRATFTAMERRLSGKVTQDVIATSNRANAAEVADPQGRYRRGKRETDLEQSLFRGRPVQPLLYLVADDTMDFKPGSPELEMLERIAVPSYSGSVGAGRGTGAVFCEFLRNGDGEITALSHEVELPGSDNETAGFNVTIKRRTALARKYPEREPQWAVSVGNQEEDMYETGVSDRSLWLSDALSISSRFGNERKVGETILANFRAQNAAKMASARDAVKTMREIDPASVPNGRQVFIGRGEYFGRVEGGETFFGSRERIGILPRFQLCLYNPANKRYHPLTQRFTASPSPAEIQALQGPITEEKNRICRENYPGVNPPPAFEYVCLDTPPEQESDDVLIRREGRYDTRVTVWTIAELMSRKNLGYHERENIIDLYCTPLEDPDVTIMRLLRMCQAETSAAGVSARDGLRDVLRPLYQRAPDKRLFLRAVFNGLHKSGWISRGLPAEFLGKYPDVLARSSALLVHVPEARTVLLDRGYDLRMEPRGSDGISLSLADGGGQKGAVTVDRIIDGGPVEVLYDASGPGPAERHIPLTELTGELRVTVRDAEGAILLQSPFTLATGPQSPDLAAAASDNPGRMNQLGADEYRIHYVLPDSFSTYRSILRGGRPLRAPMAVPAKNGVPLLRHGSAIQVVTYDDDDDRDSIQFSEAGYLRSHPLAFRLRAAVETVAKGDLRPKLLAAAAAVEALAPGLRAGDVAAAGEMRLLVDTFRRDVQTASGTPDLTADGAGILMAHCDQLVHECSIGAKRPNVLAVLCAPSTVTDKRSPEFAVPLMRVCNLFLTQNVAPQQRTVFLRHMMGMYEQESIRKDAGRQTEFLRALFTAQDDAIAAFKAPRLQALEKRWLAAAPAGRVSIEEEIAEERKTWALSSELMRVAETRMATEFPAEDALYVQSLSFGRAKVSDRQFVRVEGIALPREQDAVPGEEEDAAEMTGYYLRYSPGRNHFSMRGFREGPAAVEDPPVRGESGAFVIGPRRAFAFGVAKDAKDAPQWHRIERFGDLFADVARSRYQTRLRAQFSERKRAQVIAENPDMPARDVDHEVNLATVVYTPPALPDDVRAACEIGLETIATPAPEGSVADEHRHSLLAILDLCTFEGRFDERGAPVTHAKKQLFDGLWPLYERCADRRAFLAALVEELRTSQAPGRRDESFDAFSEPGYVTAGRVPTILASLQRLSRHETFLPLVPVEGDARTAGLLLPAADNCFVALAPLPNGSLDLRTVHVGTDGTKSIARDTKLSVIPAGVIADGVGIVLTPEMLRRTDLSLKLTGPGGKVLLEMPLRFAGTEPVRETLIAQRLRDRLQDDVRALAGATRTADAAALAPRAAAINANLDEAFPEAKDRTAFLRQQLPATLPLRGGGRVKAALPQNEADPPAYIEVLSGREAAQDVGRQIGFAWQRMTEGRLSLDAVRTILDNELTPLLSEWKGIMAGNQFAYADLRAAYLPYVVRTVPLAGFSRWKLRADGVDYKAELVYEAPARGAELVGIERDAAAFARDLVSAAAKRETKPEDLRLQTMLINGLLDRIPADAQFLLGEEVPALQRVPRLASASTMGIVLREGRVHLENVTEGLASAEERWKSGIDAITEMQAEENPRKVPSDFELRGAVERLNAAYPELRALKGSDAEIPGPFRDTWFTSVGVRGGVGEIAFNSVSQQFELNVERNSGGRQYLIPNAPPPVAAPAPGPEVAPMPRPVRVDALRPVTVAPVDARVELPPDPVAARFAIPSRRGETDPVVTSRITIRLPQKIGPVDSVQIYNRPLTARQLPNNVRTVEFIPPGSAAILEQAGVRVTAVPYGGSPQADVAHFTFEFLKPGKFVIDYTDRMERESFRSEMDVKMDLIALARDKKLLGDSQRLARDRWVALEGGETVTVDGTARPYLYCFDSARGELFSAFPGRPTRKLNRNYEWMEATAVPAP